MYRLKLLQVIILLLIQLFKVEGAPGNNCVSGDDTTCAINECCSTSNKCRTLSKKILLLLIP